MNRHGVSNNGSYVKCHPEKSTAGKEMKLGLIYATSSVLKDLTVNHCDEAHDACAPHLLTDMKTSEQGQ